MTTVLPNIKQIRFNNTNMDYLNYNSEKVWPKPYTELEYLESTGTQIINTLVEPTINHGIEIDFQFTTDGKASLFGSRENYYSRGFMGGCDAGRIGNQYYLQLGSTWRKAGTTDYQRHTMYFNKNNTGDIYLDTTKLVTISRNNFSAYAPIYLFGDYDGENANHYVYGACKIYSCKIYNNNVLIKDYIPVLDRHNVACLYDKVNHEFVYNSGTGDFIGG